MATADIERLHYYQRQYLGAADFEAEQTYLRDMRRRHNIGQHALGIVVGLELVEQPSPGIGGGVDVFIQPGMAVDGYGREIFVLAPTQLDPVLFDTFLTRQHRPVYIEYSQQSAQQPGAGYQVCDVADQYARVVETFQIVVDPKPPLRDDVIVGGKALKPAPFPPPSPPPPNPDLTIPPDESVPYQELPDDQNQPKWLIRLGSVFWDGPNKQFITTIHDHYFEKRVYTGVVAGSIFAPADKLTISPREIPSDASPADLAKITDVDFAEVRGRLQVDGSIIAKKDINLDGGKLNFLDAAGADGGVPLWMQRQAPPSGVGVDLRVHIGNTPDRTNRLSIGPAQGSSELAVLAVRGDNTVKIETGTLDFGQTPRQMINLWSSDENTHQYGIGIQNGAMFLRTDREFYWYRDGDFNATAGKPGSGGAVLMKIDDTNALTLNGDFINTGNALIGSNNDTILTVRRIQGKTGSSNAIDDLFLNFQTGKDVVIGNMGGAQSALRVSGDLRVRGNTNLIHIEKRTFAKQNKLDTTIDDNPRTWDYDYSGIFDQVYTVFAVLQGYSIGAYEDNFAFTDSSIPHSQSADAIPQHTYVRVTSYDAQGAHGVCFCSESKAGNQFNNTVLFTVVVIGRQAP